MTAVTANEQISNIFFVRISTKYLYTTITKNVNLINILINVTEIRSTGIFARAKQEQNTHVFDTTASRAKWRPRRDDDGRKMSLEFLCACPVE